MFLQQRGCLCLGPAFPTSSPYPEGCCLLHLGNMKMHSPASRSGSGPSVLFSHSQTDHYKDAETMSRTEPPFSRAHSPSQRNSQKRKCRNPVSRQDLSSRCSSHPGPAARRGQLGERRGRRGVPGRGPAALRRGHVPAECGECEWHA